MNLPQLLRVRFAVPCEDYRPMSWPIKHPYWCSGSRVDAHMLVAYVESTEELLKLWPDAIDIDVMEENAVVTFSGRFPRPDWYKEPACIVIHGNRPLTTVEHLLLNSAKHMERKLGTLSAFHQQAMAFAKDMDIPVKEDGEYKLTGVNVDVYLYWHGIDTPA